MCSSDLLRHLLFGHLSSLGTPRISALSLPVGGRVRPLDLPDDVAEAEGIDQPVTRSPVFGRPYIQIRNEDDGTVRVRALVRRGANWEWVELLTAAGATQAKFAQWASRVIVSAPIEGGVPATGYWFIDISDHDELNAWSTEPAVVWPGEPLHWGVTRGQLYPSRDLRFNYVDYFAFIDRPREDLPLLHRFMSRRVECTLR